jgi:ArsR family transcriptional regulator, zinc-responsive transcriptional repressor
MHASNEEIRLPDDHLENNHVRQLVVDAVHNAEHSGPGVPRHHRGDDGLQIVKKRS